MNSLLAEPVVQFERVKADKVMDPIDVRGDTAFTQALRCVQFRLPSSAALREPGYFLALGIRYGMVGMAASHHLLITSEDYEEERVLAMIDGWPSVVEDHVRWEIADRLPLSTSYNVPHLVGRVASLPLRAYLPLYRRLCPLSAALDLVSSTMLAENRAMICEGWSWFRRKGAVKAFQATLRDSARFALLFFERRQAGLEEVPQIALIGE